MNPNEFTFHFDSKTFPFLKQIWNGSRKYSQSNENSERDVDQCIDDVLENKFKDFKTASDKSIDNKKRSQQVYKNCPAPIRKNIGNNDDNNNDIPEIKGVDKKLVELILNDVQLVVDKGAQVTWNDIAGLEFAKKTIEEIIVWPMVRPDLFTGLLVPVKGLLLFGPPGTGKTLIGKCIANQCCAKFFSISASSLTSKWFGEGEKLVRALFEVAKYYQPSVVFMDEVDSLLTSRKDGEHESTRRIKTEFLVQLDGCGSSSDDRILIIGATNRPQELDDAARRRFVKRLYVPLPDNKAREQIINNLLSKQSHSIEADDILLIVQKTCGYSGADMMNLCKEAALGPIRDIKDIANANINDFVLVQYLE
ncbi:hypothetical protein MXB_5285 [Myxobolus squamalis]|nr:hypothetical protein MXB_5285 [Myxobolus squamalis]